ncbi:MAG: FHA domain-containing protein [Myxococcota bacterium]
MEEYKLLYQYVSDASHLSVDAFRQRYGEAFLLHNGSLEKLKPYLRTKEAGVAEILGDKTDPAFAGKLQAAVFAVCNSGRSPFPNFVSVGRANANDVVISHPSVSKFHAFFRNSDNGEFVIQDGGSKNGTMVNRTRVPGQSESRPVVVESGARVSFGHVHMTFYLAEEFHAFVRHARER